MAVVSVTQGYRFALEPTPAQERALRSHAGAARFAWNWGLARCKERYAAERRWYSAMELHKLWNEAKKRKGRRLGFPKFKKRGKCRDSFRFGAGVMRCAGTEVTLPRLGTIRTHEYTRKLARRLENGTARILSATVSSTAQRWFVSFTAEVERAVPDRHVRPGSVIGLDLGVKTLLTGVDDAGNIVNVDGPKALRSSLRKLRRASRADLAARYETIVAEDLNVTGMLANRRLARAISDQGLGAARRMLGYKTTRNGGQLVVADRWYPSSRTCSACGWRKPSLLLSERTFTCAACGLVMDRDQNAARNLLDLAASGTERLIACGGTIRPGQAGRVPVKQEPGTVNSDQTGTAARQREAAA